MGESERRVDEVRRERSELENHMIDEYAAGRISRREFVRRGTVIGMSIPIVSLLAAACGGEEEAAPAARRRRLRQTRPRRPHHPRRPPSRPRRRRPQREEGRSGSAYNVRARGSTRSSSPTLAGST